MRPLRVSFICAAFALSLMASCEKRKLAPPDSEAASSATPADSSAAALPEGIVAAPQFLWMHQSAVSSFVASAGFGHTRHMFDHLEPGNEMFKDRNGNQWRMDSILLVSLMEHDPWQVYLNEWNDQHLNVEVRKEHDEYDRKNNIPRGPQLRDLTPFENLAVRALQENTALIPAGFSDPGGKARFLGAITAQQSCLECHKEKKVGDLLGAFTWVLTPLNPEKKLSSSFRSGAPVSREVVQSSVY